MGDTSLRLDHMESEGRPDQPGSANHPGLHLPFLASAVRLGIEEREAALLQVTKEEQRQWRRGVLLSIPKDLLWSQVNPWVDGEGCLFQLVSSEDHRKCLPVCQFGVTAENNHDDSCDVLIAF